MNSFHLFASLVVVVLVSCAGVTLGQNITTTLAPPTNTTTTLAPPTNTTTATTTPAPSTNTTTATTTKPTTPATTTKPTTPAPKDTLNTYNGTQGNQMCIQVKAKIDFKIKYDKTGEGNVTQTVPIPATFTTKADCGNKTESLSIMFYNGWELNYSFEKDGDNYYVSAMNVKYVLDEHLPNAVHKGETRNVTFKVKKNYMKANGDGYVCKSKIGKDSGNDGVTVNTEDLKYKAFNKGSDIDFKKTGLECSADEDTNSIVPIAVGAALAGLVIIVLIAYLIGRKRTRKTGYESV